MSKIVRDVFNKITYKMDEIYNSRIRRLDVPTYVLIKGGWPRRWQIWNKILKIVSFEQVKSNANSNNETITNNNGNTKPNSNKPNSKNTISTGGSRVRKTRCKYKKVLHKKIKSRSTKRRK